MIAASAREVRLSICILPSVLETVRLSWGNLRTARGEKWWTMMCSKGRSALWR
jgi:hypothetical protein